MKISVDDKELFVLSETQKRVISSEIPLEILDEDLKRRLKHSIMNKYERCFDRLKSQWEQRLADNGVKSIPTSRDEFAKLVFSQPNYRDRSTAVAEAKAKLKEDK